MSDRPWVPGCAGVQRRDRWCSLVVDDMTGPALMVVVLVVGFPLLFMVAPWCR